MSIRFSTFFVIWILAASAFGYYKHSVTKEGLKSTKLEGLTKKLKQHKQVKAPEETEVIIIRGTRK